MNMKTRSTSWKTRRAVMRAGLCDSAFPAAFQHSGDLRKIMTSKKRATRVGVSLRWVVASVALTSAFTCHSAQPTESPQATAPSKCTALRAVSVAHTTLSEVETIAAGAYEPPVPDRRVAPTTTFAQLPAFCRVAGTLAPTLDSKIGFELWLPASNWNGRFLQVGNGGAAGAIVYRALADGLRRGYAVTNTDTGHVAGGGDFAWAVGHPERLTDFAYRAVHELTISARALVSAYYGKSPVRSYWSGCSTGGRQGLMEAQRFPDDYDGIVAGAPANNWAPLMAFSIVVARNVGPGELPVEKLPLLKEAAIAQCDALDGVTDRVIGAHASCKFDPARLACGSGPAATCLTSAEVAAARRIYSGIVNKSGEVVFPGTGVASETAWARYAIPEFHIGASFFQNVAIQDPKWDSTLFDVDSDVTRLEAASKVIEAISPDVSAFIARGGKLLLYHGTTDGLIPYGNTENYYKSVVAASGAKAPHQVRFYTVPGMDHCAGGEGASAVDWLGALESWDQKPASSQPLLGRHPASGDNRTFTRPVCAYPQVARYNGSGNVDDAGNWSCAPP